MRRRRERGALLGVVLVLTGVVLAAGVFAFWGLRSDTSSAGADRLGRQLFDCAEQGLAVAKQYFSQATIQTNWDLYLASNLSSSAWLGPAVTPNGPFPTGGTGTPPANYPDGLPYTNTLSLTLPAGGTLSLQYTFGLFNPATPAAGSSDTPYHDADRMVGIYSRCVDVTAGGTRRSRSVSAILTVPAPNSNDYLGVDGHGFRNQGNFNNVN